MTDRIARRIRMIEMTLESSANELGAEKVAKLKAEIEELRTGVSLPMATEDATRPMGVTVISGNTAPNTLPKPVGRGRTRRVATSRGIAQSAISAAFNAPAAAPVAPVVTVESTPVPVASLPEPMVTVTDDRTTFKKMRNGRWGLQGKNLTPGATATVTKRNGETTEVVVGKVLFQDTKNGFTLAYIKEAD